MYILNTVKQFMKNNLLTLKVDYTIQLVPNACN